MKVLQITTNYPCKENPIFGIFMKEQIESLEKYGVINKVIFSNCLKSNPKIKFSATFIHLKTALKLFYHLKFHKYDIIHCHSALSGLILKIANGLNRHNHTVWSLQNDPDNHNTSDGRITKLLYNQFNQIIVKKPINLKGRNIVYLPNGVNLNLFRPMNKRECKTKLGLDETKRYILFVDSNTTKKRTQKRKDRYDKVMTILKEKYGHNNLKELVMIKTAREEVPIWMNSCDMYLLTSDEEGSPNAVKEAMACNLPVVSTPVGNVPDLFNNVSTCYMSSDFNAEQLAELANKVLTYSGNIDTRNDIIEKGLDLDSIGKRLFELYKKNSNN